MGITASLSSLHFSSADAINEYLFEFYISAFHHRYFPALLRTIQLQEKNSTDLSLVIRVRGMSMRQHLFMKQTHLQTHSGHQRPLAVIFMV